jgi:capsular exopolysaccharide synthesis family protein
VLNAVGEELLENFDNDTLADNFTLSNGAIGPASRNSCINITSYTDTSALNMVATTKNPELSAAICNIMSQVAPDYIEEAVGVGQINTIDTAKVYNTPVSPNMKKNAMLGALIGAVLTMAVIIAINFFDNTVKDTDSLSETYNKPIIGEIQQFNQEKKKKGDRSDNHVKLTDKDVPFAVVESYKAIRTNVNFALSTFEKKVFTVSSTSPAEGKSTTSANIAIALAQGGSKTLLIDADLRKSVQHRVFGLKNSKGLSSAISKMADIEQCISKNVMENLDVMPAGPIPPNPSELLASESMTEILEKLSERYDMVIIDTPPVNVVTDSMELAKNVSGTIMVVRYGDTTTDDVDEAMKKIEFFKMNMLGFILNGVKTKHSGKYYSKYKYKYYKYGKSYGGYGYGSKQSDRNESEIKAAADENDKKKHNHTKSAAGNVKKSSNSKKAHGKKSLAAK